VEELIRTESRADGVLLALIDMPGRTMNVFSSALMDALESVLERVERDPNIRSVVISSAKSSFLAGADLAMVSGFTSRALTDSRQQMFALCGRLGRLFLKLENCAKPWVAAVNGTALGGGLELAMACRARLVADDKRALIGLPEVTLGLLPGAGGTQRLPRLIGLKPGLDLLLTGRSMDPAQAAALGLFERVVPAESLMNEACALAVSLQGLPYDSAAKFRHRDYTAPAGTDRELLALAAESGISSDDVSHYPAYRAIIRSVAEGAGKALGEATDIEMARFLDLMFDPVAGNMVSTLFLNRQRAEKAVPASADSEIEAIRTGEFSADSGDWPAVLAASRMPLSERRLPTADSIEVADSRGGRFFVECRGVKSKSGPVVPGMVRAVLSAKTQHGRVMEIVGSNVSDQCARALARLARRLGALAYRTRGDQSVLQRLASAGSALDALAGVAVQSRREGLVEDPALLDVAAVVGGLAPAYTGGPLMYAQQHQLAQER
jgi:3-hydroxyacyl-CoA dehydrogenase/enoyl-CoA hydratase/3-hydroxybutyryl-CoA epimerase